MNLNYKTRVSIAILFIVFIFSIILFSEYYLKEETFNPELHICEEFSEWELNEDKNARFDILFRDNQIIDGWERVNNSSLLKEQILILQNRIRSNQLNISLTYTRECLSFRPKNECELGKEGFTWDTQVIGGYIGKFRIHSGYSLEQLKRNIGKTPKEMFEDFNIEGYGGSDYDNINSGVDYYFDESKIIYDIKPEWDFDEIYIVSARKEIEETYCRPLTEEELADQNPKDFDDLRACTDLNEECDMHIQRCDSVMRLKPICLTIGSTCKTVSSSCLLARGNQEALQQVETAKQNVKYFWDIIDAGEQFE